MIIVFLLSSIVLGVWVSGKSKTLEDFSLGGRSLPWWAILGSIVATETSTATFLSVTGKPVFDGGDCRFLQLALGYILGRTAVSIVLLPQYFRGKLNTAYEVLDRRFGKRTQRVASMIFLVARNLGDGLRLYLCGIALNQAMGMSMSMSIWTVGLVTLVYTMIGGMRSVVWNDCIQFVIYILGGFAALAILINAVPGGLSGIWEFASQTGRTRVFVLAPNEGTPWFPWLFTENYTIFAGLLGGMFLTFGTHGVDQMMVQRYLCAGSQREAARALIVSGFVILAQFALFLLIGIGLGAFAQHHAIPESVAKPDRVFSWFIATQMPIGLCGLTLAAVFAAAMSTLSSSLNASATAVVGDFLPVEKKTVAVTQVWTVFFGIVQILIALAAQHVSQSVVDEALTIAGFTVGILLGIFLLGLISRTANERAAMTAMILSSLALLAIRLATPLAGIWYAALGTALTLAVGLLAAKFIKQTSQLNRETEIESGHG